MYIAKPTPNPSEDHSRLMDCKASLRSFMRSDGGLRTPKADEDGQITPCTEEEVDVFVDLWLDGFGTGNARSQAKTDDEWSKAVGKCLVGFESVVRGILPRGAAVDSPAAASALGLSQWIWLDGRRTSAPSGQLTGGT